LCEWLQTKRTAFRRLACRNVEVPRAEIREDLIDLRLRIHDERPASSNRLLNRIGVPEQKNGIVICLQFNNVAVFVQLRKIELRNSLPLYGDTAANDVQKDTPPRYTREFHTTTGRQPDNGHERASEGLDRAAETRPLAGNQLNTTGAVLRRNRRNVIFLHTNVMRRGHRQRGWKVEAQLEDLQLATGLVLSR
jgi:hypothetical protein